MLDNKDTNNTIRHATGHLETDTVTHVHDVACHAEYLHLLWTLHVKFYNTINKTSNTTRVTEVRSTSARLFAGMWRPLASVITIYTTLNYVAIIFHCQVWYYALSLRYAYVQSSGVILIPQATFVPNLISFTASIAELAHREKLRTQSLTQTLTHPACLILIPWEPKRP